MESLADEVNSYYAKQANPKPTVVLSRDTAYLVEEVKKQAKWAAIHLSKQSPSYEFNLEYSNKPEMQTPLSNYIEACEFLNKDPYYAGYKFMVSCRTKYFRNLVLMKDD